MAVVLCSIGCMQQLTAQQTRLTAYRPGHDELVAHYRRAAQLDSTVRTTVFKTTVQANWLPGGNAFWYRNTLKDSVQEYFYVDALKGVRRQAFETGKMLTALQQAGALPANAKRLGITDMRFSKNLKQVSVNLKGTWWLCQLPAYTCTKISAPPADTTHYPGFTRRRSRWQSFETDSVSPDKQWTAFIKDGNVYVQSNNSNTQIRFTTDGTPEHPYGSLAWSPDSKYVVGYRIDPVQDSVVYYVLSSQPGTTRGQLRSHPYKQPGDRFTTYEMYLFPIASAQPVKVQTPLIDFFDAPALHWRSGDARYFLYEKVDRGHQRFRIIEVDAATGNTRTVLDEQSPTFIYESRIFTAYLPDNKIVWTSEKDGWRHIYLVDALSGSIQPVTKGNWLVRDIDSIDVQKKEIWFSASGMHPAEDPYQVHYYRIGFDGSNLLALTPADAQHTVVFSPGKKFYLDTYSKINVPPVTELRRTADGKKILELEQADVSLFKTTGVPLPEIFHAKGRDGVTDIWGVVCRPSWLDTTRSYPVIENIYAGPQDAFVPKSFLPYSEMQSLAELGFIVVQIDGMGTANRSKAFHDVCWKNLADAGFPDRILWIKALAQQYGYVDSTRVGLYGTSAGGQNALGGLLFHPEFYKAGVAACGCHDNRVDKQWWNEQWMGYPVGEHYAAQSNVTNAAKLQGDLLLIVGEADTNVPPESTYRVADALIKAGKSFDFLPVPGMGHSDGGPYGRQKKRDFFVKHLLGVDPPQRNSGELAATK